MRVALTEIEVLREAQGISEVRSKGTWREFDYEFYVPSDTIVDGRYLQVIATDEGEFMLGAETYRYSGELYDVY